MMKPMNQNRNYTKGLLVVEDEDLIRRSIARTLTMAGYDVLAVASAEEALVQLSRRRFDLCLVDIKLSQMNGLEFLERAQSLLEETGKVILTGYGSLEETIRALVVGVRDFVTKPISPEALLDTVHSVLTKQRLSNESHRRAAYEPLLGLARLVSRPNSPNGMLSRFLSEVMSVTGTNRGALFLVHQGQLNPYHSEGFLSPPKPPSLQSFKKLLDKGEMWLTNVGSALSWPVLEPLGTRPCCRVFMPMVARSEIRGLAILEHSNSVEVFSQSEIEFLLVASALVASSLEGVDPGLTRSPQTKAVSLRE